MSNDDRFKQARRSLMNSQAQRHLSQPPSTPGYDDEHTELVDLESLRQGAAAYEEAQEGEKTAVVDVAAFRDQLEKGQGFAPDIPRIPPSRSGRHSFASMPPAPSPSFRETPMMPGYNEVHPEENTAFIDFGALPPGQRDIDVNARTEAMEAIPNYLPDAQYGAHSSARTEPISPHLVLGAGRIETFTMDTNDLEFIEDPPLPSIVVGDGMGQSTPLDQGATTQSFNLGAIGDFGNPAPVMPQRGGQHMGHIGQAPSFPPAGGTIPPDQDSLLRGAYQFEPHQIQRVGELMLIQARNAQGANVVVRQIWNQAPDLMPQEFHDQVLKLGNIDAPALIKMHGMFTSHSGRWIEFEAPRGETLSQKVQQSGPLSAEQVKWWLQDVATAIDAVHAQGLVHLNLSPDAIWLHEPTKQVYLEPFGLFAFKDRDNLGVFGAQELHRTGTHDPSQGTDYYSLAMVILYAMTGSADQGGVVNLGKAERAAVTKALDPSPNRRAKSAVNMVQLAKLTRAGAAFNPFDKRVLVPVTALVVLATLAWTFLVDNSPPPPLKQVNFKEFEVVNKDPVAAPPGEVKTLKDVKVVKSFATLPAKETNQDETVENPEKAAAAMEKGLEALSKSTPDPAEVLRHYANAVRSGLGKDKELEMIQKIRNNKEVLEYYKKELVSFEQRLSSQAKVDAGLQRDYANLAKIIPGARYYSFLSRNRTAPIKKIEATPKKTKE